MRKGVIFITFNQVKDGYFSCRVALHSHLSFQKHILESSFMTKDSKRKRCFFDAIRPTNKCESPGFQNASDTAFQPKYLFHGSVYQTSSRVSSLKTHLMYKASLLTRRPWIPRPPPPLPGLLVDKPHSIWFIDFFSFHCFLANRIYIKNNPIFVGPL